VNPIHRARRHAQTVLSIVQDALFDWRFGVETRERVAIGAASGIVGDHEAGGRAYHPTRGRHLSVLWRALDLPDGLGLLDVGCGKGLVLLRASREPFRRVVGVEYAASLVTVAEANRARFLERTGHGAQVEVVHADAATWPIPTDIHVLYFFNPFDETVFVRAMERVHDSFRAHPRPMWLVVNKAHFDALVCGPGVFSLDQRLDYGSAEFSIYRAGVGGGGLSQPSGRTDGSR